MRVHVLITYLIHTVGRYKTRTEKNFTVQKLLKSRSSNYVEQICLRDLPNIFFYRVIYGTWVEKLSFIHEPFVYFKSQWRQTSRLGGKNMRNKMYLLNVIRGGQHEKRMIMDEEYFGAPIVLRSSHIWWWNECSGTLNFEPAVCTDREQLDFL